jgi:UDP-N-acetyl-D-galactosamine dehydrogenase
MGKYIAEQTVKQMIAAGSPVKGAKVNVLGLTFKEDCADIRNTKVVDILHELQSYGVEVFVHDPQADPQEARHEYGVDLKTWDELPLADAVVMAVAHQSFRSLGVQGLASKLRPAGVVVDVKASCDAAALRRAGYTVWRL